MPISFDRSGAIPALTGLRFAAALMVFFSHYNIPGLDGWALRVQGSGYSGVTFFFVLSGFIITYNYLGKFESNALRNTFQYIVSRFARIYPLYALCIIYPWMNSGIEVPLLPYLAGIQAWSGDVYFAFGINGPAWSISVEIFLYLTLPLLIPILSKLNIINSRNRLLVFALSVFAAQLCLAAYFSLPGRSELTSISPDSAHRWLYRMPATRIFDFCLGIAAAIYYKRHFIPSNKSQQFWSVAVGTSLSLVLVLMGWRKNFLSAFSWDASYAALFAIVILGVAINQKSRISEAFSGQTMILLGESSFAFYLIHAILRPLYTAHATAPLMYQIMHLAIFLLIVTCVSIGLHLGIEKPLQKMIRNCFTKKKTISITI
ncbi:acyltransferase [Pseudomonas sp.]|uniref:acyltransferase family protein n=1 Tax=Pseudomonas sp. TaxID=306 RepID=UPI0032675E0C